MLFSFRTTKNNVFFKDFLPRKKREKTCYFHEENSIRLKSRIRMFFLRQKSKRKGKGAVSSAPLSFVSSLTKAHIKHEF